MKRVVSVLCHTLSGNAFGRALVIADLLKDDFQVHIVAACHRNSELWGPARDRRDLEIRRWTPVTYPGFLLRSRSVAREIITGDLIYSIKPRLTSFGLGLMARTVRAVPLILDVDDYEVGFSSLARDLVQLPWSTLSTAGSSHTRWLSRQTHRADAVTVSSSALYRRYGGTWIPHARDERTFIPRDAPPDATAPPSVMFVGTPRQHKGLDDLISAFGRVKTKATLTIVGGTLDPALVQRVHVLKDPRICLRPPVAMTDLPALISAADVIAIPQRSCAVSEAQLPAKLLDAMALGKAIVATNVGDIPRWLANDAGVVVPPGDSGALAHALERVLNEKTLQRALGERARQRFLTLGSVSAVRPRLVSLVENTLSRRPSSSSPAPAPPFSAEYAH